MRYLVLIGDMEDSRHIKDRHEAQNHFKSACNKINKGRKHYGVVSPFMVTLGDEFQGVLMNPHRLWEVIAHLELEMFKICQFRFSIGFGEISTELSSRSSLGMDGPAFYLAREGIESLRKRDGLYGVTGLGVEQGLVQYALDLWSAARRKWNYNRMATFCRLLEGVPVPQIAVELGVTEQAVYRTRRDGELDTVIGLLKEISKLITTLKTSAPWDSLWPRKG